MAAPLHIPLPRMPRPHTWVPAERDGARMMEQTLEQWRALGPGADLWVFAYA